MHSIAVSIVPTPLASTITFQWLLTLLPPGPLENATTTTSTASTRYFANEDQSSLWLVISKLYCFLKMMTENPMLKILLTKMCFKIREEKSGFSWIIFWWREKRVCYSCLVQGLLLMGNSVTIQDVFFIGLLQHYSTKKFNWGGS